MWWDDDDDIQPYEQDPRPVRYAARWDYRTSEWTCLCPDYRREGKCRHARAFRHAEWLDVSEEYL